MVGVLRGASIGGGDIRWERLRDSSWWARFVCVGARLGTIGASAEEEDVVDDRGWLVIVADRLGDGFESTGEESCGEASGLVMLVNEEE